MQHEQSNDFTHDPEPLLDTSKILVEKGQKPSKDVYYIPGFLRIKVKNFTEMNLDNLNAQMNATIIFSIYYGSLRNQIVQMLMKNIIFLFGRDDAIQLSEQNSLETKISNKTENCQIQFTIRKLFQLRIESQVFWSPFEIINLILSVTVQPVVTQWGTVKINLLDHPNNFLKLSYTQQGTFGNYDLAEQLMRAMYTNDRVCKVKEMKKDPQDTDKDLFSKMQKKMNESGRKEDKKIEHFQYAHFNIPLYKFPMVALATIFLPLWLLGLINLAIFFQDNNLADRIASIAALMIAFVALIPTIRAQIPPNPHIVFVQILVYLETLTSLFALIHSIDIRSDESFNLIWYQDGLFMVSFIIFLLTIIIILVMLILHFGIWQPNYNRNVSDEKEPKFIRKQWRSKLCDLYFTQINKMRKKKLQILPDPIEKRKTIKLQSTK